MMGLLLEENKIFVLMFQVNFLGLGLLSSSFFSFFSLFFLYLYTYNLKQNAALTHVTSFRLMTPRPVGLRALGVETPLRA
jgi:hypothetical protein